MALEVIYRGVLSFISSCYTYLITHPCSAPFGNGTLRTNNKEVVLKGLTLKTQQVPALPNIQISVELLTSKDLDLQSETKIQRHRQW